MHELPRRMFLKVSSATLLNALYHANVQAIESFRTAHGIGSDTAHTGYATIFSNNNNSNASSLGRYLVLGQYISKTKGHGLSIKLKGLDSTNNNAELRKIVIHANNYMEDSWIKSYGKPGRSWGCFVLSSGDRDKVAKKLEEGSLIFAINN